MDADALVAAGLYDPNADDAEQRLELLDHLLGRGASVALIRHRLDQGDDLFMVATSLTREWPPVRSVRQLAEESGANVEAVTRVRLALGFAVDDPDVPTVRQTLADDLAVYALAVELFGEERVLAFVRVLGASAARIGEAASSLFGDRMAEIHDRQPTLLEMSQANEMAITALEAVPALLGRAIVEHLGGVSRRLSDVIGATVRLAVGFVDLVDSTRWAATLSIADYATALTRFEVAASELAARHGGRVVKLIGDEAMVVADHPHAACLIATGLCAAAAADADLPSARGAVGFGPVHPRDGDYFGALVNTVARATKAATPGTVVAVTPAGEMLPAGWRRSPPYSVELRGVEAPVVLETVALDPSS